MVKALVVFRALRPLSGREERVELHGHQSRVYHDVFGRTRVDALTLELHGRHCGVEGLVLEFSLLIAVQRVGVFCSESLHIECVGAGSDLLVRSEGYGKRPVRDVLLGKLLYRRHDLRDAGLVVSAQDCGAVRCDEGPSPERREMWKNRRFEAPAGVSEGQRSSVVVLVDHRLYIVIAEV